MGTGKGLFEDDTAYERRLEREANKEIIEASKKVKTREFDDQLDSIYSGGLLSNMIGKITIGSLIGLAIYFFNGEEFLKSIGAGIILAFIWKYLLKFFYRV